MHRSWQEGFCRREKEDRKEKLAIKEEKTG
jgi:hypothetical protein